MENFSSSANSISNVTSCSCSLITIQYKVERAPTKNKQLIKCNLRNQNKNQNGRSYNTTVTTATHTNTNYNKKSKISLSRSMNQSFSNDGNQMMKYSELDERCPPNQSQSGYETLNIYNRLQNFKNIKNSIISNASEVYNFKKRQNSFTNYQKSKFKQNRWKFDLQHTKNTTFDNSLENSYLKQLQNLNLNKRMLSNYEFSFHNEKKSDQKTSNRRQRQRQLQQPLNEQNEQTSINNFSSKLIVSNPRIQTQSMRRIKTLKQLDYRQAQSSGGGTSQNHMSTVVSIDEQRQEQLKGLDGLIRKSSLAFRLAKTQHLMNEVQI